MNLHGENYKQGLDLYVLIWMDYLQRKSFQNWSYGSLYCLRSDNEEDRGRPSYNGQSGKEFKDEETVTTKSVHIVQATETTATRKRGVPSKKVDLGAAAHYTGAKSPDTTKVERALNMHNKTFGMCIVLLWTVP